MPEHRPTLVVFTLGPESESRRRQLLPERLLRFEDRLHRACLEAVLAAGNNVACNLEVSAPLELPLPPSVAYRPQESGGFGARLEAALAGAFSETDSGVILVGSDTPDLTETHLEETLQALEDDPDCVVVGPSLDGGLYLLAAAMPLGFSLSDVPWRSRNTLECLIAALRSDGRPFVLLEALADLDHRSDLERWLSSVFKTSRKAKAFWSICDFRLLVLVARLLARIKRPRPQSLLFEKARNSLRVPLLRGPPRRLALLSN